MSSCDWKKGSEIKLKKKKKKKKKIEQKPCKVWCVAL